MSRTLLVGYYGMRNFGDDLFCHIIGRCRPRLEPGEELVLAGPRLPGLDVPGLVPAPAAATFARHHLPGSALRAAVALAGAARCDGVLLGGGSVLHELHGVRRLQLRLRDRLGLRRWRALGVSVGPFDSPEHQRTVEGLLSVLDDIVVRDERSARATSVPTTCGGDLAALVPQAFPTLRRHEGSGTVLVPKRGWSPAAVAALAGQVARSRPEEQVHVLCLNSHPDVGDQRETALLVDALARRGVPARTADYHALGVEATLGLLAGARRVVTGRLHGAIVAYVLGIPMVLAEDTAKMTDFLDDIGQPAERRTTDRPEPLAAAVARLLAADGPPVTTPDPAAYLARAATAYRVA